MWSASGGRAKSNTNRARKAITGDVRDLMAVRATLLVAMTKVEAGEMDAGTAGALASLARAVVAVSGPADIERRVDELERALSTGRTA